MFTVYLVMFIIASLISIIWVRGVDKEIQYRKENPDYKPGEGWLDWDDDNAHTENQI